MLFFIMNPYVDLVLVGLNLICKNPDWYLGHFFNCKFWIGDSNIKYFEDKVGKSILTTATASYNNSLKLSPNFLSKT
tara:strand:- start:56 stop:286 length:231 start_codon:yes stop_codon:yes gene_type:complete